MRGFTGHQKDFDAVSKKIGPETYTAEAKAVDRLDNTAFDKVQFIYDNYPEILSAAGIINYSTNVLFYKYVASEGQTVFTGQDVNERNLSVGGNPIVFVNYVERVTGTFSFNVEGTEITFNEPLHQDDIVMISAFYFDPEGGVIFDFQSSNIQGLLDAALAASGASSLAQQNAETAQTAAQLAYSLADAARILAESASASAIQSSTQAGTFSDSAAGHALAALSSETIAATQATLAQQSAATATLERQSAETARAAAEVATVSATLAQQSAESAAALSATSATNAATAETEAGQHAAAAATHTSIAESYATSAAQNASATAQDVLSAETAQAGAVAAQTTAVAAQQSAEAASAAALNSQVLSASSATEAGNHATAALASSQSAASSATTASQEASVATSERLLAETARAGAEASEASAATSATTATNAASNASSSETVATNAATAAGNSATAAANSASTASSEASDAAGSAASASSSESVTAQIAAEQFPHDFEREDLFWINNANAPADSTSTIATYATFPTVDGRKVAEFNGSAARVLRARGLYPAVAGRTYRVTAQVRQIAGTPSINVRSWLRSMNGSYQSVTDRITVASIPALNEWISITKTLTVPDPIGTEVWVAGFFWSAATSASDVFQVRDVLFEDVTESTNAAASASAAATSASTAAASETAAGQHAAAAQTAETNAQTAQAGAEAAQTQAATSATSAAGSEAAAANSETAAANSETQAGLSATAAANSASTASTQATNAAQSATAAQSAQTAAETAQAGALASEIASASSETNAAGHAASAQSSSILAADIAASVSHGIFSEHWLTSGSVGRWETFTGSAELSIVEVPDAPTNGKALRIGNNSGNDEWWALHEQLIPFDPSRRYKTTVVLRRTQANGGAVYLGFAGVLADGTTLCNVAGTATYTSQHFHAAVALYPGSTWETVVGYTEGYGTPNGTSGGLVHENVRFLRPLILANYNDAPGIVEIASFIVEDVTESTNAAASASAAALSASIAQASETAAGSHAAAAQSAQTSAETAEANAIAAEVSAVSSETSAAGSAASALASATLAARTSTRGTSVFRAPTLWGSSDTNYMSRWSTGGTLTITPGTVYESGWDWTFDVTDTQDTGLQMHTQYNGWLGAKDVEAFIVEVEFTLNSGSMDGAGVYARWFNTTGAGASATCRLVDMEISGATGEVQTASTILKRPTAFTGTFDKIHSHFFAGWGGFLPMVAKNITVHRWSMIPTSINEARIDKIETLDLSAGTALATFLNEMQVDANGNSAAVATFSQTSADVTGFASAFSGVSVSTNGGNVAGFYLNSWADPDGSGGSMMKLLGDVIVPGTLTVGAFEAGLGENLVENDDFMDGLAGWASWGSGDAGADTTFTLRAAGSTWSHPHHPVGQLFQNTGDTTGFEQVEYKGSDQNGTHWNGIPVIPGQKYGGAMRVSTHRCSAELRIQWYDQNNSWLATSAANTMGEVQRASTDLPEAWHRLEVVHTAPAGAAWGRLTLRKLGTYSGQSNSYCFFAEPLFSEVHTDATKPPVYSKGGKTLINGNRLRAGSVTADKITVADLASLNITVVNADIENATLTTAKLAAGAIQRTYEWFSDVDVTVATGTGWTQVMSKTVTFYNANPVLISVIIESAWAYGNMEMKIERDGVNILDTGAYSTRLFQKTSPDLQFSDRPGAGTFTYNVFIKQHADYTNTLKRRHMLIQQGMS